MKQATFVHVNLCLPQRFIVVICNDVLSDGVVIVTTQADTILQFLSKTFLNLLEFCLNVECAQYCSIWTKMCIFSKDRSSASYILKISVFTLFFSLATDRQTYGRQHTMKIFRNDRGYLLTAFITLSLKKNYKRFQIHNRSLECIPY